MPWSRVKNPSYGFILALTAILLGLYLYTLNSWLGGRINVGDTAKWQFIWAIDGTPHSPGYPLYLLLTKAAAHLFVFFEEPFLRINFFSTVCALVTLVFVYLTLHRSTGKGWLSFLLALMLGTSRTFWSEATEAEVYTLHTAFLAVVTYCFVRYGADGSRRYLVAACFLYALSFGNHLTSITLLPAIVLMTVLVNPRVFLDAKLVATVLAFIVLGVAQYSYIYYVSHYGSGVYLEGLLVRNPSWETFVAYVTGSQWGYNFGVPSIAELLDKLSRYWQVVEVEFGELGAATLLLGAALAIPACALQWRKSPAEGRGALFLTVGLICAVVFALSYNVPDFVVFLLPAYLFAVLVFGPVAAALNRIGGVLVNASLCALVLTSVARNFEPSYIANYYSEAGHQAQLAEAVQNEASALPLLALSPSYHVGALKNYYVFAAKPGRRMLAKPEEAQHLNEFLLYTDVKTLGEEAWLNSYELTRVVAAPRSLSELLDLGKDHVVLLVAGNEAAHGIKAATRARLNPSRLSSLEMYEAYAGVLCGGKLVFESSSRIHDANAVTRTVDLQKLCALPEQKVVKLISRGGQAALGPDAHVYFDRLDHVPNRRGLNFVVLTRDGRVLRRGSIDTSLSETNVYDLIPEDLYLARLKHGPSISARGSR